jgi:hypothetical protein
VRERDKGVEKGARGKGGEKREGVKVGKREKG